MAGQEPRPDLQALHPRLLRVELEGGLVRRLCLLVSNPNPRGAVRDGGRVA